MVCELNKTNIHSHFSILGRYYILKLSLPKAIIGIMRKMFGGEGVNPIIEIDENRNYWLIRTEAGEYYDEFYHDKFVGMGWDELNQFDQEDIYDDEFISEQVCKIYPKVKQAWRVYSQVRKFMFEVKIGDIVLIPSSSHISFGIVESDVYYQEISESELLEGLCPFKKRRQVSWLKTIRRDELDPYLYRLLNSHFTISNALEYAPFIDRTLHGFYVRDGQAHLVLRVKKEGRIFLREINKLTDGALEIIDLFNDGTDSSYNSNEIESKINVQSPGPIELIAGAGVILALGLLLHYILGGKYSTKITLKGVEFDGETDGLLEKILKFKKRAEEDSDTKAKLAEIKETMESLKLQLPDELKEKD